MNKLLARLICLIRGHDYCAWRYSGGPNVTRWCCRCGLKETNISKDVPILGA